MLTVHEQLMHSTVRIECQDSAGSLSGGTGFLFRFFDDGTTNVPVIVTNKHVVRNAVHGAFHLTRARSNGSAAVGDHLRLEFDGFASLWIDHPDQNIDLTILPIASIVKQALAKNFEFFYRTISPSFIPDREQMEELSGLDDIVMVGYPDLLWDSTNNLPIFRSGSTATHPKYDYEGKPWFLIDCACFPGSSGSPVFVYNPTGWTSRSGERHLHQERLLFLGVLFAGPQHVAEGIVETIEVPELARVSRSLSNIPNNLGFVVKSGRLLDFEPILRKRRGDT